MSDKAELKSCPFCGEQPDLETLGTWIEISCCVNMSFQKCDYLTMAERQTWSSEKLMHSDEAEAKALNVALKHWNTRAGQEKV